jgi:dephospho-CoA kinase
MLIIGLTGGIGSGKSTVSRLFADHGVPVIDADVIARELVQPGQAALESLIQEFGPEILDDQDQLDRTLMRELIFSDSSQRKRLEAILHPLIREEMHSRARSLDAPYCLMCIPLLIESRLEETVDRILIIDTPESLQIRRTLTRDGVDTAQVQAIIDTQVDRQTRLAAADDIIHNDSTMDSLRKQVDTLHQQYLEMSAH